MLLVTLGASLLENIPAGKGTIAASHKKRINKKGKRIIREGEGSTKSLRKGRGIVRAGYGRSLNSSDF